MNWKNKSTAARLFARFSTVCHADPEGDPAPLDSFESTGGGQVQEDAGHDFNAPAPEASEAQEVADILALENDPNHSLSMDQIASMMSYNPAFAPKATPAAVDPNAPKLGPDGKPLAVAPVVDPNAPPAQAVTPPAQTPTLDPNVSALVTALNQTVTAANAPATDPNAGPKPYFGGQTQALQVADPVLRGLLGVEEGQPIPEQAAVAVNTLINGLANRVMQESAAMTMAVAQRIMQHIPQAVGAHTATVSNTQAFYNDFPELNKPAFAPVINGITGSLAAAMTKEGKAVDKSSPEFRKRVGEAVHLYIEQQMGVKLPRGVKPVVAAAPAAKPGAKPAPKKGQFFTPGGTRPPAGPGTSVNGDHNQSADLRSLVL